MYLTPPCEGDSIRFQDRPIWCEKIKMMGLLIITDSAVLSEIMSAMVGQTDRIAITFDIISVLHNVAQRKVIS